MATFYSGVHEKLKSPHTPWTDKLRLARFAWASDQCLLSNKEQYLFDWVARALSGYYNKKIDVQQEIVEDLWTFLKDILYSQNISKVQSEEKTIVLSPSIPQMINERISEGTSETSAIILSSVLCICHRILSFPILAVTYTAKYELLLELVARLSALACFQLNQETFPEPLSAELFDLLLLVLSTYLTVQKQQGNPKRVFTQVTQHLLHHLCLLRHLLMTKGWTEKDDLKKRQNLSKDVRNKVDAILQSALFFFEHLPLFKDEVLPAEKRADGKKALLCPVAVILSNLVQEPGLDEESLFYAVRTSSIPLLFKMAVDSFCKGSENKLVCFHIMTKLLMALDFTEDLNIKETFNPTNWSLALLALENILNACLAGDIYNVASDKIHHGEVQFNFYRKVAQLLFNNAQTDIPAWYRCLKTLLTLNHQILVPDIDEFLSFVWVDADNMELRVKNARETLVCAVLQTYTKLRQLPKLFEVLLIVICQPAADELRQPLLPEALQKCLNQCLLENPLNQNVEICQLIVQKMQHELYYVQERRHETALKMFSMCILLHTVLFSLKSLDDVTPVPTVRQTQGLMQEIVKVAIALLQHIEKDVHTDSILAKMILEVGLLLTHIWHEADTLFQSHCSKYTSLASLPEIGSQLITIEKVLALTSSKDEVISPLGRLLQKLLALHKMKRDLLSLSSPISDKDMHNLEKTVQFIVASQNSMINNDPAQTWDCQLCSLNSGTYSVAFWFLVTTNLPLIAPYFSQEVKSQIADTVLNSLLQGEIEINFKKSDLSLFSISKQLLESSVLWELPDLTSAVVTSITNRWFGLLSPSDAHAHCPSFFKSYAEIISAVEDKEPSAVVPHFLMKQKAVAQEVMNCAMMGVSLPVSETNMDEILKLVRIARVLNPYSLSPEDYLKLFISSFFMTLCVQQDGNGKSLVSINLLKELLGLMEILLVAPNSQMILKVVHGSTLLEAVVTSRCSCLGKGLFQGVDSSDWFSLLQSVQHFIQCLINLILERKSSVRVNVEKFTHFIIEQFATIRSSMEWKECDEAFYLFQLHLATLSTVCNEILSVLGKNTKLDETLTELLVKSTSIMAPAIQTAFVGRSENALGRSFCIHVLIVMIKSELAKATFQNRDTESVNGQQLPHMAMYKDFAEQIFKNLCSAPQPVDFLTLSLQYLSIFYLASETSKEADIDNLHFRIMQSVFKLLSSSWMSISNIKELEASIKELFSTLMVNCSVEQFRMLFLSMIRSGLVAAKVEAGHQKDLLATVTLIKVLACCSQSETSAELFWRVVPQIISSLVAVVRESGSKAFFTSTLTVPAVETLTTLLRQGEHYISDPHTILMALGALEFVPLECQSVEEYYSSFKAIHEALFAIILCYPKVMLKGAAVFLNSFYRLVKSIIYEGRQKGETDKETDLKTLLQCAMLVERMYTHIGSTAESFTVLNCFIVAQYVSELQRVTVRPEIKAHLTEGIYCILDHCIERDIKFLNRTLSVGVQEVFSDLYKNYTHYHKSQRQGEEKYTV